MQHCLSHVNRTQHRRAVEGQTYLPHGASAPKSRGCHSAMPMAGAILQCHQGWRLLKVARRMCQSLTPGRELPLLNAEPCELCCRSQLNNRPLPLGGCFERFSFIFFLRCFLFFLRKHKQSVVINIIITQQSLPFKEREREREWKYKHHHQAATMGLFCLFLPL